ncbi:MAG: DedA family protein [Acidobacteria bacterium]|nr:DedA family protein [Acidobacteriota bacterium]
METAAHWIAHYGYIAIFSLLSLGILGIPAPEEWLPTFAGYLTYKNTLRLWPAFAAVSLGSMCGITVTYMLGRSLGLYVILRYGRILRVKQEDLDKAHAWFDRFGAWVLFGGYFIPGVRHVTALIAGASKLRYLVFSAFAYAGAVVRAAIFIGLGYYFGDEWSKVVKWIEMHSAICASITGAVILVCLIRKYGKKRKDEKTVGSL